MKTIYYCYSLCTTIGKVLLHDGVVEGEQNAVEVEMEVVVR